MNTALYRHEDLQEHKEDYYPVVIYIETHYPKSYQGKAKKSVQFIYGCLAKEENEFKFNIVQKKFLYNNKMFILWDLFGIKGTTANISND